ncbi:hypothetical protein [Mesoflavibacter sp. SCSIO 43206]|uniref:hypothetical protein n=1 Tax=Mesoflavibacter sp. SCSIO 43206 TaxID=2779362 RepID=UPI001CA98C25|nr:hypothetical protein [Mesoflavibacter sp. SCSIO 43206]UAB76342.1 hypothetical protein INR78_04930 [Mesoflavibacter sp. SCSIO 43206]
MLKKIIYITFFVFNYSYSQSIIKEIQLLSEVDSTSIEYAHIIINGKLKTYSNQNGKFELNLDTKIDTLSISHLEFRTKNLLFGDIFKNDTIYLQENSNVLDEVFVSKVKKVTKVLLPKKSIRELNYGNKDLTFPYGFKIAVYVPNEEKNNFFIKKIVLKSKNKKAITNSKFIPFKVNLMTCDTINNIPDKPIFKEDLVVGKFENQPIVEINLDKIKEIPFPKNGIYVVVSLYDETYYLDNGFINKPSFGIIQLRKNSKFRQLNYYKYFGEYKWTEPFYSKEKIQSFNFGIEVEN